MNGEDQSMTEAPPVQAALLDMKEHKEMSLQQRLEVPAVQHKDQAEAVPSYTEESVGGTLTSTEHWELSGPTPTQTNSCWLVVFKTAWRPSSWEGEGLSMCLEKPW